MRSAMLHPLMSEIAGHRLERGGDLDSRMATRPFATYTARTVSKQSLGALPDLPPVPRWKPARLVVLSPGTTEWVKSPNYRFHDPADPDPGCTVPKDILHRRWSSGC